MSRKGWIVVAAFLVAALAGAGARLFLGPPQTAPEPEIGPIEPSAAVAVTEELVLEPANLYFPSLQGGLRVHQQALPAGEPIARIRHLVETLIEGPGGAVDGDLYSPVPKETALASVYFLKSGAVALDLRSKSTKQSVEAVDSPSSDGTETGDEDDLTNDFEGGTSLALGSKDELLAIYSLVNTITLNQIEGVDQVVLLWDGRQPETFAGHIDVSRPLTSDTSWVITP